MKRVLIVDDDVLIVKLLSELLAADNISIVTASDGAEAWEKIQRERFDLLITDVWMPQMNGLEVQSQVRELSPSTRVIMFTGKEDPLVRSTSLRAGASAFFTKPFDDEEFLTAVRFALS